MNLFIHQLIVILSIIVALQSGRIQTQKVSDLYSDGDHIIRLNSTTFIPTVFHQNKNITFVVQFYNTFCGHCQAFAPTYKELAGRVQNWTSVIKLAGVDCSKDENTLTCRENDIQGYPTIYIYPPNAQPHVQADKPTNLRSLGIQWTVDDIEETLLKYLEDLPKTRKELPLVVKALEEVQVDSIKGLRRIYPYSDASDFDSNEVGESKHDLMLIVEPSSSYLGRKLIVEYFRIHSRLEIRRVTLSNKALLKQMLTGDEFAKLDDTQPLLLRIVDLENGDDKVQVLVRGEERHVLPSAVDHERADFIQHRFKMFLDHFYSIELDEYDSLNTKLGSPASFREKQQLPPPKLDSDGEPRSKQDGELELQHLLNDDPIGSRRIFAMDLLKGISYMITHEIAIKANFTQAEFNTIRNMLTLIKKYFPLDKWDSDMNRFIEDLRTQLDNHRAVFESTGLTGAELSNILELTDADKIRLRYQRENWVSCSQSDRQNKGYTCSLWLIFHSLTVGEYIKSAPVNSRPSLVLNTMRDYITKFLGCTVCSTNFEKETESLGSSITARNSSIMWLWRTHNHVNQRLNNEKNSSQKQNLASVLFPSHSRCSECYATSLNEIGLDGKTLEDVKWDETNILNFIIDVYRPDKIVTPKAMGDMLHTIRKKLNYKVIEFDASYSSDKSLGLRRVSASRADMNRSMDKWNIFSSGDIGFCLFLYISCIVIVSAVCIALNPKWIKFRGTNDKMKF